MKITLLAVLLFFLPQALAFDSAITNIDLNNGANTLLIGDQYTLRVGITNDSASPVSTVLTVFDNNVGVFTLGYQISALSNIDVNVPFSTTLDGNHLLMASIDVNDDNPADNNFVRWFFFKKGIDVSVSGIFFPLIQQSNTDVNAKIFVQNQGDLPSWFFDADLYLDGNKVATQRVNPLQPNEFFSFDYNFSSGANGNHVFSIVLDSNLTQKEFLRANNSASVSYMAQPFSDSALTRADIEQIIQDFFDRTKSDLQDRLDFCNQTKDTVTLDLNACQLQRDNYFAQSHQNETDLQDCQKKQRDLDGSLSLADATCNDKLQSQNRNDQNSCNLLLSSKDSQLSSAAVNDEANGLILWVLAVIVISLSGFIVLIIYKRGGLW